MAKIAYIRVSSEGQNLDRQEDMFISNADKVFREKLSGKDKDRPELMRMLEYVRDGDVIIVESLSRLGRSMRDLLSIVDDLRAKKVGLISLKESIDTETPQGRFMTQVFAALSELEREAIRERQKEGIEAAKKRGKHLGRPRKGKPADWDAVYSEWKSGRLTAVQARRKMGLPHATFYQMVKLNEKNTNDGDNQ